MLNFWTELCTSYSRQFCNQYSSKTIGCYMLTVLIKFCRGRAVLLHKMALQKFSSRLCSPVDRPHNLQFYKISLSSSFPRHVEILIKKLQNFHSPLSFNVLQSANISTGNTVNKHCHMFSELLPNPKVLEHYMWATPSRSSNC